MQIRFNLCFISDQIKLKINIHLSPDVLSTLMLSEQGKLFKLQQILHGIYSRPEVFCRKAALKNFAKFTGKQQYRSLFLIGQACNFIKKRFQYCFFPVNFAKFLRTHFLKNICDQLLLDLIYYNPPPNIAKQ